MLKKILFFGITIILGVMLLMVSYYGFYMGAIQTRIDNALKEENYDELASVFLQYFNNEETAIAKFEGKDNAGDDASYKIIGYEATILVDTTIKIDEQEKQAKKMEKGLVLFVDDIKMNFDGIKDGDKVNNYAGVKLYNETDENNVLSYNYTFNDPINATSADAEGVNRYYLDAAKEAGFVELDITESIINEKLNGKITSLEVVDSQNRTIGEKITFDFTFAGEFYDTVGKLITEYDKYLANPNEETANTYLEYQKTWNESYTYSMGYTQSVYKNTALYLKTAAVMGVYIVICAVLGYFILRKRNVSLKPYQVDEIRKQQAMKASVEEVKKDKKESE